MSGDTSVSNETKFLVILFIILFIYFQANMVKASFQGLRDFLVIASKSKKPAQVND